MSSNFPTPPTRKNQVKQASKRIAKSSSLSQVSQSDIEIVDQWRVAHAYVLNTFQALLRNKLKNYSDEIEFAQRLKRKRTVLDKISSQRCSDVLTMHDLAGCRLIFPSRELLDTFRDNFLQSRHQKHVPKHFDEPDKYNYIKNPKDSGYRGIHDVIRHYPRKSGGPWDNLLVEIQYRTINQHAWATAVEVADIIKGTRNKFEWSSDDSSYFFRLASEIISRYHEDSSSCLSYMSWTHVWNEFKECERRTNLLSLLKGLESNRGNIRIGKHTVLYVYRDEHTGNLYTMSQRCRSNKSAISEEERLSKRGDILDVVYVKSDKPNTIYSAYRNYFLNSVQFVELIEAAMPHGYKLT